MMPYDAWMRTTLTIDDAIARALEDPAHRSNRPFKQVVNEILRVGLSATAVRRGSRGSGNPPAG